MKSVKLKIKEEDLIFDKNRPNFLQSSMSFQMSFAVDDGACQVD